MDLAAQPFDFAPGEEQIYNNSAFFLLGLIIEKVSGMPYETYVQKNLFDRAGMKELLSGLMIPAEGFFPPGHQWFGKPTFKLKYDPAYDHAIISAYVEGMHSAGSVNGTHDLSAIATQARIAALKAAGQLGLQSQVKRVVVTRIGIG